MPGLFKEGFMDNNFLRYHILLKDGHSENENKRFFYFTLYLVPIHI